MLVGDAGQLTEPRRLAACADEPLHRADPISGTTYFTQTDHNLPEPFLSFWLGNGQVAGIGYPVSEPFDEYNTFDNQTRQVQYFERAELELTKAPDGSQQVSLGALGLQKYKQRYGKLP